MNWPFWLTVFAFVRDSYAFLLFRPSIFFFIVSEFYCLFFVMPFRLVFYFSISLRTELLEFCLCSKGTRALNITRVINNGRDNFYVHGLNSRLKVSFCTLCLKYIDINASITLKPIKSRKFSRFSSIVSMISRNERIPVSFGGCRVDVKI